MTTLWPTSMSKAVIRYILCVFTLLLTSHCFAQSGIVIDTITIEGNKRTKPSTIYLEGGVRPRDTIVDLSLSALKDQIKNQLLGTGLFNTVDVQESYGVDSSHVTLDYIIVENWYLFPSPILEFGYRNFNVWWNESNRNLDRLIYGVRVAHYNLTGGRDKLKINMHAGYTRKLELTYDRPNVIGDQDWGFGTSIFYSDRREISYKTEGNKPLFYEHPDERFLLKRFRVGGNLIYRPNTFLDQLIRLEFHKNDIDQVVAEDLNPDYFLDGKTGIRFFYLEYDLQIDKSDYNLYPSRGHKFRLNLKKEGLFVFNDIDNAFLLTEYSYFTPLVGDLNYGAWFKARANLSRAKIPFSNNTGMGYGDFLITGYDLYVMDGPDYIGLKNNINYKFLDKEFKLFKWFPRQFRVLPMKLYLRFNYDVAYINEPTYADTNFFNNTWIYGFGPSLDIIIFNNYLFSIEYGINQRNEKGIFLQSGVSF